MLSQIKQEFYSILDNNLEYDIRDYALIDDSEAAIFPQVFLKLETVTRDKIHDIFKYQMRFKIDIYSNYVGEKEIMDLEAKIFSLSQQLYNNPNVTYVRESGFRILDDKSTGSILKHGIINYQVIVAGMEVEDETNTGS